MTDVRSSRRQGISATLALLLAAAAFVVWIGKVSPVRAASAPQRGYVAMADGTLLHYTLTLPESTGALPASTGRFPVVFMYGPYGEGYGESNLPNATNALLANGYALLGVSIRGTGCSGGTFDLLSQQSWQDGATVVEWAARQTWSDGNVGMWGFSYPGMATLGVAAERPAHLDAIAPFHSLTSSYRDVGYPGGIFNPTFAAGWSAAFQPRPSYGTSLQKVVQEQDPICAQHVAEHAATGVNGHTLIDVVERPFEDEYWTTRAPGAGGAQIEVPVFSCITWQDEAAAARETVSSLYEQLDPNRTWIVAANGSHGQCGTTADTQTVDMLVRFFDRYVKGVGNGFERVPRVQIWHETQHDAAGTPTPRWVTTAPSWQKIRPEAVSLYFRQDGRLSSAPPSGVESADSYVYPTPAPSTTEWDLPVAPGGSMAYTTPPLDGDAAFFGPGSADLWLASTATDTDVQITLTEVRPDGQELYVQRGWLRASHRTLDAERSTALKPYHTHKEADVQSLTPGQPTQMRVDLFPVNHVFRAGSSIRLWIDAPTGLTGLWGFDFLKTPARNTILHDNEHQSRLVLGYLPRETAQGTPLPACDTVLHQPCRSNPVPVPSGTMAIVPPAGAH